MNFILFFHFIRYLYQKFTHMETVDNILRSEENSKSEQQIIAERAREILKKGGSEALDEYIRKQTESAKAKINAKPNTPEIFHSQDVPHSPATTKVPDVIDSPTSGNLAENVEKIINKAPVDKSLKPTSKPASLQDAVMMLYPKSAALGRYSFSELGEDILSIISKNLQGYMTRSIMNLKPDILGEISLRIDTTELVGDDKKTFIEEAEKMMTYKVNFWWKGENVPHGTKNVETTGVIISAIHNYVGTSYVDLVVNKWALPFLLYYGPGAGANLVNSKTSFLLPGKYTKRLHKILSGYVDNGTFEYRIRKLIDDFQIPKSYTNATIKRSIIEPAVKNINDLEEDFSVEYEFVKRDTTVKSAKLMDTVLFTLKSKNPQTSTASAGEQRDYILRHLPIFLNEPYASQVWKYVQTWQNHGDLGFVYAKVKYYNEQASAGKMKSAKAKNFLIKALEEETHIKLHTSKKKKIEEN